MVMVTPANFEDEMKQIKERYSLDKDAMHRAADELMCQALIDNGYASGVKVFEEMPKWYA